MVYFSSLLTISISNYSPLPSYYTYYSSPHSINSNQSNPHSTPYPPKYVAKSHSISVYHYTGR